MSQSPFPGPIAPESNPPINPQFFIPSVFVISAISLGETTIVTATDDMNYVIGQIVRLIIPSFCGAQELNEKEGIVIAIPASDQVELNIFSEGFTPFSAVAGNIPPQIVPVGDINSGVVNAQGRTNNGTFIPGSFINISPL